MQTDFNQENPNLFIFWWWSSLMESCKLERFSLRDVKAWENSINIYKYLKGGYKEGEVTLFSVQQDTGQWAQTETQEVPP